MKSEKEKKKKFSVLSFDHVANMARALATDGYVPAESVMDFLEFLPFACTLLSTFAHLCLLLPPMYHAE